MSIKFLTLMLCLTAGLLRAQTVRNPNAELGLPYLRNYSPQEYKAHSQNWCIAQDNRGIMYFGNSEGVLEYDGSAWRVYETGNGTVVRSLSVDSNGVVYVGAQSEFGFLSPDSLGDLKYVSLVTHLDSVDRNFSDVWQTHTTPAGVYFTTPEGLYLWNGKRFKIWRPRESYYASFFVNGSLYVRETDIGLLQMISDSLHLVRGGDRFAKTGLFFVIAKDSVNLVLGTREGLVLYDGLAFKDYLPEASAMIQKSQLYHGTYLPNGDLALATIRNGILLFDESGNLKHVIDKSVGLIYDEVLFVFVDKDANLWAGLDYGISRLESALPLTVFDERLGLKGAVEDITRHSGKIYAGTSQGLFVYRPARTARQNLTSGVRQHGHFTRIKGVESECWDLLSFGDVLLVAAANGIYIIRDDQVKLIVEDGAYYLLASRVDPNRVFVGLLSGLSSIYRESIQTNQWRNEGKIKAIQAEVRFLEEGDEVGDLWLCTEYRGVSKLSFDYASGSPKLKTVRHFAESSGLPALSNNYIFRINGVNLFSTEKGVYRFDEGSATFKPDSTLGTFFSDSSRQFSFLLQDADSNIWYDAIFKDRDHQRGVYLYKTRQIANPRKNILDRFSDHELYALYVDADKSVWYGGPDLLIRYQTGLDEPPSSGFSALIRKVTLGIDSVIYSGSGNVYEPPQLVHRRNAVTFQFSATNYEHESSRQFQYYLEGFDDQWSKWIKENQKSYTNLPDGTYKFHVRAKDMYSNTSRQDSFSFIILPAWYNTWWAYLVYVALFFGVFYSGIRFRIRILERRNRALEEKVQERTHKLEEAMTDLKNTQTQLFQAEKMASLGQLVAGIAHEINNPLGFISGNIDVLDDYVSRRDELVSAIKLMLRPDFTKEQIEKFDNLFIKYEYDFLQKDTRKLLEACKSGSRRIQNIIEDLRNFSRLDTKDFVPSNIHRALDSTLAILYSRYRETVEVVTDYSDVPDVWCFPGLLNQVFMNVIANAIESVDTGGKISVTTSASDDYVRIEIQDNGCGIAEENMSRIFDPFFSTKEKDKGIGLGLSMCYNIIQKHDGQINITSQLNEGYKGRDTAAIKER